MQRGFSTLELMIAFALLCIVFAGVGAAEYGSQYWTLTLTTSSEGLSTADQQLEEVENDAAIDFQLASSSNARTGNTCQADDLCSDTETTVDDESPCAKYVKVVTSWRASTFPTSTISLATFLVDLPEVIAVGGDCGVAYSDTDWVSLGEHTQPHVLQGAPIGIDALGGVAYVIENNPAILEIIDGAKTHTFNIPDNASLSAVDVARDLATGRVYAYMAATSTQLRVVDVTDSSAPALVASTTLSGVTPGVESGWRLQYYDTSLYILTRFLSKPSLKEFHVFDVSNPKTPTETGSFKLNTSAYALLVRDQKLRGGTRRFAYLATTHTAKELMVLDVTNSQNITTAAICDIPSTQQGNALFILGNTLYFGRENVPNGGEDLYAFNATDPTAASFCTPIAKTDINDDSFSRHVQGIRAKNDYLFTATNNTTNAHGKIQVRTSHGMNALSESATLTINNLIENGIDFDEDSDTLYALEGGSTSLLHIITAR